MSIWDILLFRPSSCNETAYGSKRKEPAEMSSKTGTPVHMPFEVRKEMIKTLFGRPDVIILGVLAHVTCMIVAALDTGDWRFLIWIPLFCAVAVVRMINLRQFDNALPGMASMKDLDRWESYYILLGSCGTTLVGLVATYTAFADPESLAAAIGQGMVGGTMISIVGRNFGSLRNVKIMCYTCCLPVVVGYFFAGFYHSDLLITIAALPVLVVILTGLSTSGNLHNLLLSTLLTKRQSSIVSRKFEAAISSMPNGLIVVDGHQRMVVINREARNILGIGWKEGDNLVPALEKTLTEPAELVETLSNMEIFGLSQTDYQTRDARWLRFGTRILDTDGTYLDDEWGGKQDGAYILTISDVTTKVEDERKLVHLARFDGLTGLANRRWWEEHVHEIVHDLPEGGLVALAVLDIDRFKLINDTLGHHVGDRVIQGVAARIRAAGDARAFPGRMGGDEFVVLLERVADAADAAAYFDHMFNLICSTYEIDGHMIEVRCSGGAIVRTRDAFNLHNDMSRADLALYKVKRTSRAWLMFDSALEDEYQSSVRIKHDLKAAITDGDLQVVYQPIYDARGERLMSVEALCRWKHDTAGSIPPAKFIAMAEEIGVIGQLTEYVLRRACADCMTWPSEVSVAVNLSALDLARDGIVEMISDALEKAEMPASRLCVEVTETVFVKEFEKTAATLLRLRSMGVKTSLDDFGTGYSSLSYMHRLPLNRVKIDKSFIENIATDLQTQQLFSAVVGLAKGLGFEVVVEGVETNEQLALVVAVKGVDMIQGHVFSEGLTSEQMSHQGKLRPLGANDGKVIRLLRDGDGKPSRVPEKRASDIS